MTVLSAPDITLLIQPDGLFSVIDTEDLPKVEARTWRVSKVKTGRYFVTGIERTQMAHFLVNVPEGLIPDHKNGCGLDNRKRNLRVCRQSRNRFNSAKCLRPCFSKYKGVRRGKNKNTPFEATIGFNYERIYIGAFSSDEAAARAYDRKARELFGEFARLNFPSAADGLVREAM